MLTKQGGLFEQALIEGGLNPLAANAAMGAVANCAQPLQHRGPISADYTPPDFKFVTPELRKYRFPNLETVSGEMPRIRPPQEKKQPKEDRKPLPPEKENQNLRPEFQPTYQDYGGGDGGRVTAGRYITVDGGTRVSLNGNGGNGDVAVFQGDRLVGLRLTIESNNKDLLTISRGQMDYKLNLKGEWASVITGVSVANDSVELTRRRCFLLGAGPETKTLLDMQQIEFVSDVQDGSPIVFEKQRAWFLATPPEAASSVNIPVVDCTV